MGVCFLYYIEYSPSPEVKLLNYIAYPNIYLKDTSARNVYKSPWVIVYVIAPLRFIKPAITPEYTSFEQFTSTYIKGSRTCG